jgi:hypothetical protein
MSEIQSKVDSSVLQSVDASLLRLLAEIGFVATACGLWSHAEAIFAGVRAVRPNSEFPVISQALARMTVGDDVKAIYLLRENALKINPDNALAKSFLCLALKRSGNAEEAHPLIESIIQQNKDSRAVEIARIVQEGAF